MIYFVFVQVNLIMNIFSLVLVQVNSIRITFLEKIVCLYDHQMFFSGVDPSAGPSW